MDSDGQVVASRDLTAVDRILQMAHTEWYFPLRKGLRTIIGSILGINQLIISMAMQMIVRGLKGVGLKMLHLRAVGSRGEKHLSSGRTASVACEQGSSMLNLLVGGPLNLGRK